MNKQYGIPNFWEKLKVPRDPQPLMRPYVPQKNERMEEYIRTVRAIKSLYDD